MMNTLLLKKPSFSLSAIFQAPVVKQQHNLKKRSNFTSKLINIYSDQIDLLSQSSDRPFEGNKVIESYYTDLVDSYERSQNALYRASDVLSESKFTNTMKDELYNRSEELSSVTLRFTPSDLKWLNNNYKPPIHKFLTSYHHNRLLSTYQIANFLNTSDVPLLRTVSALDVVEKAAKFTREILSLNNYPYPQIKIVNTTPSNTIYCIPQHINHVIFELLKNAALPSIARQSVITITISSTPIQTSLAPPHLTHSQTPSSTLPIPTSVVSNSPHPLPLDMDSKFYEKHKMTRITISDNAGGLEESTLPHIFQFHYTTASELEQLDEEDMKDQISGFGMGLPLCQVITGFNGGRLEILNRVGEGVDAIVDLPSYGHD
ncbi:hypothetical protein CANARDRAFT_23735 [[Candida] arabinofermentans NRRL YB-2248]|uniref:Protein-serine/threonine kinase n=1 Tax=[Candida] arabinofermentans NRRL YB-2248 TaxID=983967 RepID=A0A1E4SZ13_9ASCO|nr:hypothetical protein CANARDRAFT_23735 [[Candida] arabinofermentans NRRL YB-2248]